MISFYPGPSRVYDDIPRYVKDAHRDGVMSINHRSEDFIRISKRTIGLLKQKLSIPKTYTVFFTSSATECWEIIAQSLGTDKTYHIYNGAFGQKWYEYTKKLNPGATPFRFEVETLIDPASLDVNTKYDVVCITQNETSNGTQVNNKAIREIQRIFPDSLIAVDATSSMAGIRLDFKAADIWFASVQKCFGLPAGLGVMVCSPKALDLARKAGENAHYNSLTFMMNMMEKWQTSYTPNVLGIYLLMRVLEKTEGISTVEKRIVSQYREWVEFLENRKEIAHFVKNKKAHSYTVIPVRTDEKTMVELKAGARKNGLLLGEGYGDFKPHTFRIANFPAIKKKEITTLQTFLKTY